MGQLAVGATVIRRLLAVVVHLRLIGEHYPRLIGCEELGQKCPVNQWCEQSEVQVGRDVHHTQAFDATAEEERAAHRLDQIDQRQEARVHVERLLG